MKMWVCGVKWDISHVVSERELKSPGLNNNNYACTPSVPNCMTFWAFHTY